MSTEDEQMDLILLYELYDVLQAAVKDKSVIVANQTATELFKSIDDLLTKRSLERNKKSIDS